MMINPTLKQKGIGEIHTYQYGGQDFQIIEGWHDSSLWSFEDEDEIRNKFWHPHTGVVYDIGAAYGSYSIAALLQGATVHAFEPMHWICEAMAANVKLNNLDKFTLHEVAISDSAKSKLLSTEIMEHGTPAKDALNEGNNHVVEFRTLDSYLGTIPPPDWIKVDVEGQELRVLRGGEKTLETYHPKILAEIHLGVEGVDHFMRINGIYEDIKKLLKKLDYQITEQPYHQRLFIYVEERHV